MLYPGTTAPRTVGSWRILALNCLLLVIYRHVAGAEVHRAGLQLADAAAAADRLIVDLNVGVLVVVLAEPLLVNGIGEGRPGPVQFRLGHRAARQRCHAQDYPERANHVVVPPEFCAVSMTNRFYARLVTEWLQAGEIRVKREAHSACKWFKAREFLGN